MTLREHFTRNGIDGCLTPEKEEKLIALSAYLTEYNKKVNLTAITDEDGIYAKHITDCALILPFIRDGASVLDVGCGGGFPMPIPSDRCAALGRNDQLFKRFLPDAAAPILDRGLPPKGARNLIRIPTKGNAREIACHPRGTPRP